MGMLANCPQDSVRIIFLLTDGDPDCASSARKVACDCASRGSWLLSIGIGSGCNHTFLKEISNEGACFSVQDFGQLLSKINSAKLKVQSVQQELQQSGLFVNSSIEGHQLQQHVASGDRKLYSPAVIMDL